MGSTTNTQNGSAGAVGMNHGPGTWGTELWDHPPLLTSLTTSSLDFLSLYTSFLRDRSAIEADYAAKLRKLTKTYSLHKKGKELGPMVDGLNSGTDPNAENSHPTEAGGVHSGNNNVAFTSTLAFTSHLSELSDLAGQHELISENLTSTISTLNTTLRDLRTQRKSILSTLSKHQQNLTSQLNNLERVKKNYEKCWREAEKASESYYRADADLNLSRAEVEKARLAWIYKGQVCEDSKGEYASQLDKTNDLQTLYYTSHLPSVLNSLQDLDSRRARTFKSGMKEVGGVELGILPIIKKCIEGVVEASERVDVEGDSLLVIEKYKTGFLPPGPIPFEDLSINSPHNTAQNGPINPTIDSNVHQSQEITTTTSISTLKTTLLSGTVGRLNSGSGSGSTKKRGGIFGIFGIKDGGKNDKGNVCEDYSDLPPNQRKKKLKGKIEEIGVKLEKERGARDGLLKMLSVYTQSPNLGDPASISSQLSISESKIQEYEGEIEKYGQWLRGVENSNLQHVSMSNDNGGQNYTPPAASDSTSLHSTNSNTNSTRTSQPTAPSPESGISGGSRGATSTNSGSYYYEESPSAQSRGDFEDDEEDVEEYEGDQDELMPIIGKAVAVYDFEATSSGSIPLTTNEPLYIIESDQGDGWTRVRRLDNLEEGFVPTSYIQIE